ncbi:MAG: NAD(P)-dependent alcohol dehydrogenase [Bryobacterales bacterium]|nr:NAD(P)-dependent alcohol dehydrogenase [Bryobacterales bacterium]
MRCEPDLHSEGLQCKLSDMGTLGQHIGRSMRAMMQYEYGPPDLVTLREIPQPVVKDSEVLIRVRAAGLHVGDCFAMRGSPFPVRLMTGLRKPKYGVPGMDLAGQVVTVGRMVTRFRPGDEVFGCCMGACAEVACAAEATLVQKPASVPWQQAAAVPTSALAALHAIRDAGKVAPGHRVLIVGASGGVGTFAVQLARFFGAEVTGVCSSRNLELVRSLGAHHVIDYTQEDFTKPGPRYDVILDNIENRSLAECRRALAPSGTLICNSGTGASGMAMAVRLLKPLVVSPFARHNLRRYLSEPNFKDLDLLKKLLESRKLSPVIDRAYSLDETPDALRHIEGGHARGKVVVTL